jgi:DnaJ-domain-containing protein 1
MTDNFALLDEPRRPWIDPESLKEKFLALSAQSHPDRVHQASAEERRAADERFAALNGAYNCLREPKDRVRHLLELERGMKPADIQEVPSELMDSFFEIGRLCREVDAFLKEKAAATSPILKAQLFERGQEWADKLNVWQQRINTLQEELIRELRRISVAWDSGRPREKLLLDRLEEIYRLLGYFGRWSGQIRERIGHLAL